MIAYARGDVEFKYLNVAEWTMGFNTDNRGVLNMQALMLALSALIQAQLTRSRAIAEIYSARRFLFAIIYTISVPNYTRIELSVSEMKESYQAEPTILFTIDWKAVCMCLLTVHNRHR
jgi:hypothetical protein